MEEQISTLIVMIDAKTAAMFMHLFLCQKYPEEWSQVTQFVLSFVFLFFGQKSWKMPIILPDFWSFVFLFFRLKNLEKWLQVSQVPLNLHIVLYSISYNIYCIFIFVCYIFHLKNPEEWLQVSQVPLGLHGTRWSRSCSLGDLQVVVWPGCSYCDGHDDGPDISPDFAPGFGPDIGPDIDPDVGHVGSHYL